MSNGNVEFNKSLETLRKKLVSSRNGIQTHLLYVVSLAVKYNNIEGYVKETVNLMDDHGQHTYAEAALIWLKEFAGYETNNDGSQKSWEGSAYCRTKREASKECKFWTLAPKKQSSFKGFDEIGKLFGVLQQGDKYLKQMAEGKLSEEDAALVDINLEVRKQVRNLLTSSQAATQH